MGLGDSLYWPASGAAITDNSQAHQRDEAFAVSGLVDSLRAGLGIVLGDCCGPLAILINGCLSSMV